jgi:hypothetical protein
MSPALMRPGPYRSFFNSRQESRMHVHVAAPNGLAKFWPEPDVALADCYGLSGPEVTRISRLVETHTEELQDAWHRHFSV